MDHINDPESSRSRRLSAAIAIAVALLAVFYLGSLVFSLQRLADAAKSGNGSEVVALTDLGRLRGALKDQIVDAYLKKVGAEKPMTRLLANTYGASVADAMLAKFLTVENLTAILQNGSVADPFSGVSWELSPLANIDFSHSIDVIKRFKPIQIREMEVRVSEGRTGVDYSAITLHMEGLTWKLSGIKLPRQIIEKLAGALPSR